MSAVDVVLVTAVVTIAAGYLVTRLVGRRRAPACHPTPSTEAPNVVVKGALAKGLARAQAHPQRRRAADTKTPARR